MKENKLEKIEAVMKRHSKVFYHSFAIGFWGILSFKFYEFLISHEWFSGIWSVAQEEWFEVMKDYNFITLERVAKAIGILIFTLTPLVKLLATLTDCIRQKIDPNAPLSPMLVFFILAVSRQLISGHIIKAIVTIAFAYIVCELMKRHRLQERAKALDCQHPKEVVDKPNKQTQHVEVNE